jgi:transposase
MQVKKKVIPKMGILNPDAAGMDIGSASHFVAIPADRDENPVREFSNFTSDLYRLADWLSEKGIKTIAMESTGVYWIPAYEILESRGFEVLLVNAQHVKNVPGRKSDVMDSQWIQQLHSYGLLRGSFRPDQEIRVLRAYLRQRESLIQQNAREIQHMQKALAQMNIQLANVVDDITGVTGMTIIRSILAGERSPEKLAGCRDYRCKQSQEVIAESLRGNYRAEHLFALKQGVELFDIYKKKIEECDEEIEKVLEQLTPEGPENGVRKSVSVRTVKKNRNRLNFDAQGYLQKMTGVDLTRIDGLDSHSVLRIISEIGTDMDAWPTAKHFGSWLGLAPGTKISGGKRLGGKTKPTANRAAYLLRMAASTLHRSQSALGAFLRRQKSRLGAPKAITATAYKIARLVYNMMKSKKEYTDLGQDYYEQRYRDRLIKNMGRKARAMGFQLIPIDQSVEAVP